MNAVLRHLLWKDARTIASLAVAILACTLMFQFVIWTTMWMFGYRSNVYLAVLLWILMPNLMALGAPPMLVGNEEESGTLNWLRTLPVPWPMVVVSKAFVAVAAVILSWAISSLLLWLTVSVGDAPLPKTLEPTLESDNIRNLAFFTFQLLFTGFFLAYLCRSPIFSLILVLPTMIGQMVAMDGVGRFLHVYPDSNGLWWTGRILIAIAYVTLLIAAQFLPASWRFARRRSRKSSSPPPEFAVQAPQPYAFSSLASGARPGKWRVLLWQAWRQQAWPLVGMLVIAALCIVVLRIQFFRIQTWRTDFNGGPIAFILSTLFVLVCAWMGCLCFYADSISRRHSFFADRGFSKWLVWCSRIAAPVLAMVLLWFSIITWIPNESTHFRSGLLGYCVLGFACGVLSSMWMTRSALAFLVSPVLLVGILLATRPFFDPYGQYFGFVAIAALPLLIASWRLTGDWLKHAQGWMTQLRVAGYVLLAIVLVPVTFFAVRYSTMPEPLPAWRAKMLAQPMPEAFAEIDPNREPTVAEYLKPWLATHPLPIEVEGRLIDHPDLLRMVTERALPSHYDDQQGLVDTARAAQRMFEWSKAARLAVLEGEINPAEVLSYAESDEMAAISQLYNLAMNDAYSLSPEAAAAIREALDAMASEELREKSWRLALAMEWRLYQSRQGFKRFAGETVDVGYWFPRLEKMRADRNVDWAVHLLLDSARPNVTIPHRRGPDPTLFGDADSAIDFNVGFGPDFKAQIEQELRRQGL